METGFTQLPAQLKPRETLINRMLSNQTAKIISEYKRLLINNKPPIIDIYQSFYSKMVQQANQAFVQVYQTQIRQKKISIAAALQGIIKHFQQGSQFIWAELTKEQQQQQINKKQPNLYKYQNICQKCQKLIEYKNIQFQKARIQAGQFEDPFNLFGDGKMNFQDDERPQDQQPLQYMQNQKQIYAQINCLKQRITKRTSQILDFLNQLHKYTDQNNLFPDRDKQRKQTNVVGFDTCMRSVIDLIEQKVLQVLRNLRKEKRMKGLYKTESGIQVGNSFNQFLQLEKNVLTLQKQLQEKTRQLKNIRNHVDNLQQKLQKNVMELSSLKFRSIEAVEQSVKAKGQLQTQKRQHRKAIKRISQRQRQIESLVNQLRALRQNKLTQKQQQQTSNVRNGNRKATYKKRNVSPSPVDKKVQRTQKSQKTRHLAKSPSLAKGIQEKQANEQQRWELPEQFGVGMSSLLFVQRPRRISRMKTNSRNQDNQNYTDFQPSLNRSRQFNSKRQLTLRAQDNSNLNASSSLLSFKSKSKLDLLNKTDQIKSKNKIQTIKFIQGQNSQNIQQNNIQNLRSFRVTRNIQILQNPIQNIQFTYQINNQDIQSLINNKLNITKKNPLKQSQHKQPKSKQLKLERITVPTKQSKFKNQHLQQQNRMTAINGLNNTKTTIDRFNNNSNSNNRNTNRNIQKLQSLEDRKQRKSLDNTKTVYKLNMNNIGYKKSMYNDSNQFSTTLQSIYVNNPIFQSTLTKHVTQKLSSTLPLAYTKNRLNTQEQLYKNLLFCEEDVINLYLCVEGAIQHQKSKKSTFKQAQILKNEEFRFLTKVLTFIATIHISNPYYYQSIKNFILCPFQSIISQQNFILIRKSTFNEVRLKQALFRIINLHKNCKKQKNGKNCEHIQKFMKKLQNLYKYDRQDAQNEYSSIITQQKQQKQQLPKVGRTKNRQQV